MKLQRKFSVLFIFLILFGVGVKSQITWPEGQLLPSFPESAQTQDLIYLNGAISDAELYLFSSLKGIVNQTQPRIFSYEGDAYAEGAFTWLNSLEIKYIEYNPNNTWNILDKYLSEVSGLIVYDPNQLHTVNLATTMAKGKNAIIASPSLLSKLTSAPYNLPILEDLRGKFTNELQIYQKIYDDYWPNIDKRLLIGLHPTHHKGSLREYAVALGAAVIWLDPKVSAESTLLNKFFESMPKNANYMGWWPEEAVGVRRGTDYGIATIASDYSTNLTFHSGMPRTIEPKPMPAKPVLENKIYVAFILSDGDNLQYVEHLMRKLWNNPDRGSVPIGWTISPAMVDAMPGALNYYHKSSTANDNLISGPSGYGYVYPNYWNDDLSSFVSKTEEYNVRAGIRVITVWNTITGGINRAVGQVFAAHAPTLLGLTAQNTGGALSIYVDTESSRSLPGRPLSCNYCENEQYMKEHISSAASGWSGITPRFIIIQAQPWKNVTPTSFKNVKNSLGADYVVVRPDHIFQLIREANEITVNPGGAEGNGTGLAGTYYNGRNFETEIRTRVDSDINFQWTTNSPMEGVEANNFSAKWEGQVMPRYTGNYTFYITTDNVSRVWIDNQLVINKQSTLREPYSGKISLEAGVKYDIQIEYVAGTRSCTCVLEWTSAFQSREVIPQSHLFNDYVSGFNDMNIFSGFRISPNPAVDGILSIEVNNVNNEEIDLTIYDMSGKVLLNRNIWESKEQLDVSKFSKGVYLISVRTKNNSKTVRFVIN